ncbi:Phosphatidylinositol 5-phosphate 4-kinase type-2 alpha [Dinochytrium kinnereticum]|nr:Phosphatidylinositol 5-phosphate 4-kinase type-2 alpha [Dinochytrium kinnereticum]
MPPSHDPKTQAAGVTLALDAHARSWTFPTISLDLFAGITLGVATVMLGQLIFARLRIERLRFDDLVAGLIFMVFGGSSSDVRNAEDGGATDGMPGIASGGNEVLTGDTGSSGVNGKRAVEELAVVRQCRLAVRAAMMLAETSPESIAYTSSMVESDDSIQIECRDTVQVEENAPLNQDGEADLPSPFLVSATEPESNATGFNLKRNRQAECSGYHAGKRTQRLGLTEAMPHLDSHVGKRSPDRPPPVSSSKLPRLLSWRRDKGKESFLTIRSTPDGKQSGRFHSPDDDDFEPSLSTFAIPKAHSPSMADMFKPMETFFKDSSAEDSFHGDPEDRHNFTSENHFDWTIPGFGRVRFTDYAPLAFKAVRVQFGYSVKDLETALSDPCTAELTAGKSDSVFFKTENQRFLFKTLRGAEPENLRQFLPEYLSHITRFPDTFLPRYLGFYTFEMVSRPSSNSSLMASQSSFTRPDNQRDLILSALSRSFTVVVMANVFDTDLEVAQRFDFKGSTVGRQTLSTTAVSEQVPDGVIRPPVMSESKSLGLGFEDELIFPSTPGRSNSGPPQSPTYPSQRFDPSQKMQSPLSSAVKMGDSSESRLSIDVGQLTLKELDFERLLQARQSNLLHFGAERKRRFLCQFELDINLLKKYGFMDYSVLIGVHRKKVHKIPTPPPEPQDKNLKPKPIMSSLRALTSSRPRPISLMSLFTSPPSDPPPKDQADTPETPLIRSSSSRPALQRKRSITIVMPPSSFPSHGASPLAGGRVREVEGGGQRGGGVMGTITSAGFAMFTMLGPKKIMRAANGVLAGGEGTGGDDVDTLSFASGVHADAVQARFLEEEGEEEEEEEEDEEDEVGDVAGEVTELEHVCVVRDEESSVKPQPKELKGEEQASYGTFSETLPFGKSFKGGIKSEGFVAEGVEYEVYFVGIIDVLQKFNFAKWLERGIQKQKQLFSIKPTSPTTPSYEVVQPFPAVQHLGLEIPTSLAGLIHLQQQEEAYNKQIEELRGLGGDRIRAGFY